MNEFLEKIEHNLAREKKVLQNFYNQQDFEDWHLSILSKLNSELAFLHAVIKEYEISKQYFFVAGLIDVYLVNNYNQSHSRFFDYDLSRCLIPVLSDNNDLIQNYSHLKYRSSPNNQLSMDQMVAEGNSTIWSNTIQYFMANDEAGIEKNLNIIELKTLKKLSQKDKDLLDDFKFYKSLFTGDKDSIEEILEKLTSPAIHKKRNDNPTLNQFVSMPALGYAKLSWRRGIMVEVISPLIPIKLLPTLPNGTYGVPYDFLKNKFI